MWFVKGFEGLLHIKSHTIFAKMIGEKTHGKGQKVIRKVWFGNQSTVNKNSEFIFKLLPKSFYYR